MQRKKFGGIHMKLGKSIGTASAVMAFFIASGAAWGQSASAVAPPPGENVTYERMGPGPMMSYDAMDFVSFEGGPRENTVTGAPFSASFSTQTTQVLSDGNQIQRSTTGSLARDSQGRTRRDMTLPAIGQWAVSGGTAPHAVFINDPVAGAHYILHPDQKIADKMSAPPNHKGNGQAHKGGRESENVTTTPLGTQMINGVSASGTRYTRTIPVGEIGNVKPIQIVTERWYSSDLQTNVMTKRTDPIRGDTVFQLTNIQRQEPAATLFQVPSDYSVQEGHGHGGRMRQPE
jgi:hypothetical protein